MPAKIELKHALLITIFVVFAPAKLFAVEVSGLNDFVIRDATESDVINETFRGYSNFHTTRSRIFFDVAMSDNSFAFVQLLIDNYKVSLYAAYARFENVVPGYLNIQVGYIPSPIGTFAARTYSDINPVIGTPLLYNFHTSFNPFGKNPVGPVDSLIQRRNERSRFGLPIMYNACWNSGLEFYGNINKLSYSLGLLTGSLTKPTQQQEKNRPQITTRLAYIFNTGFILGFNAYYGPYLIDNSIPDPLPAGKSFDDYINGGIGYDLEFTRGYLEIHSEGFYTYWEYPTLSTISMISGYAEAKYKFSPGWYLAGRFGMLEPSKEVNSAGQKVSWDYAVKRIEIGVGRHFTRNVLAKLVGQFNRFDGAPQLDSDLIALQLSMQLR